MVVGFSATILTAVQEEPGPSRVAYGDLKSFASCFLCDTQDSKRRCKRLNNKLGKFLGGEKLQAPDMSKTSGKQNRAYKRKWDRLLAARLQKQLQRGSIKRASQCLDQAEIAEPSLETMLKLAELHPQAHPPEVDVSNTVPVHITAEIFAKVLQRQPRGSSGGPSGWTYEHIKAACAGYAGAFDVTLELMNHIVSGNLPDIPELRARRLVPIQKKGTVDGVRLIAGGGCGYGLLRFAPWKRAPPKAALCSLTSLV